MFVQQSVKKIGSLWERIWFSSYDPLPLGFFRISLGLLMVFTFLALFPNWERYYSPQGVMSLSAAELQNWPWHTWTIFRWTDAFVSIRIFWWLGVVAAVCFTVGWRTRLATVVLYVIQMSMNHLSYVTINGEDHLFRTLLFFACFAPLGATLSVDSWIKKRRGAERHTQPMGPIWHVRLMQVTIALIYVFSLCDKLAFEPAWRHGKALYWILMNQMWSAWPWPKLLYGNWVVSKLITYFTIAAEGLFPVLVWFRRTRFLVIAMVIALHLGIAIFLRHAEIFTLGMICSFWIFIPGETLRRGVLQGA